MKITSKTLIISLIAIVIGLSSCSKSSNFDIIPESATLVMIFDGNNLSEKAGFSSFADSKTFQYLKTEVGEEEMGNFMLFEPIFKNTEESGIDMKKEYFMFAYKKGDVNYMAMVFSMLDKNKLSETIKKIGKANKEDYKISSDGKWEYMSIAEADAPFIIWDDDKLIMLMSISKEVETAAYLAEAKLLWEQSSDKSLTNNKDFSKFLDDKKDVSLWMDYSIFYDNLPPMQKMTMQSTMPFDMSGTMIHFYMDFQKGKMVMTYNVEMNEEMKSFMKDNKFIKDKFDMDILDIFPAKSYANFSMAIDFLSYFEVVKNTLEQNQQSIDAMDEQMKAQTGMTMKEALNEFSGEVVMNVHRISFEQDEEIDYLAYYEAGGEGDINQFKKMVSKPVVYYSIAAEMNNDKLFGVLVQNIGKMAEKTGNFYSLNPEMMEGYFGLFGKKLLFTNDKSLIENIVDGKINGQTLAKSNVNENLSKFPTYAFVDLDFDNYPAELKEGAKNMLGEDFEVFNSLISEYKMLEIKPKSITEAEMVLWMKDDSKNSLEIILKSFDNNIQAIAQ